MVSYLEMGSGSASSGTELSTEVHDTTRSMSSGAGRALRASPGAGFFRYAGLVAAGACSSHRVTVS